MLAKSADEAACTFSIQIKSRIYRKICAAEIDRELIRILCPNGKALDTETSLFDYKASLPLLPENRRPSTAEKEEFYFLLCELSKDAVAFHNSFGGFVLAGIDDATRAIRGFKEHFACDELNKKIQGATGCNIECIFERIDTEFNRETNTIGVLYIPRRADSTTPVMFTQNAPAKPNGSRAFSRDKIYFRERDQSRPATTVSDLEFIFSKNRRHICATPVLYDTATLNHNLPMRDPSYIDFIGRESHLEQLWNWFFDKFNRVKVLTRIMH